MIRLLDFVQHDWKNKIIVDPTKVGFFGFSKAGYTGLVLMGRTTRITVRLKAPARQKNGNCDRTW